MRRTLMLVALCASPVLADEWRDYKCYLKDKSGQAWVHRLMMQPEHRYRQQNQLPGQPLLDSFGQPLAYINKVIECVGVDERFTRHDARLLDAKTPK
ncbi:TapY2 family type IVa secretion system protein [Ferrimonas balearica]|uniref:TapY2 family type IVa secretion system protein n=1 Tax=Ferrimonas balearica TaxID=44012 RepID=UPI001C55FE0B|nr:TapY2 family type IVa secretion system protein [Ferrimonas balearica]MBW3165211.1 TapY2 family type IVa secretion system protein [Ferrimonas balearica]MBY6107384.1 TapY2 family type IVa secretion system protein [Ferrimonas balearica]